MPVALDRFKRAFGAKVSKDLLKARDTKVDDALKALGDEAAALKKLGFDTKQMEDQHAELTKRRTEANKIKDNDAQYKALDAIKTEARDAVEHAKALAKSAKDVMGKSTDAPDDTKKAAIYKKALEDLYGLKIKIPKGMTTAHLDRVFDMMGSVPKSHVAQDKLKKLTYNTDPQYGGAYGGAEIEMGDFGEAKGEEDYEIDGEVIPANSFNVTTLHEIGHSIDDKKSIMKSHMAKAGCGNWISESPATVADAYVPELRAASGAADTVTDEQLQGIVLSALGGTVTQPKGVAKAEWDKIKPWLDSHCLTIRSASSPWNNAPVIVAGRVYQEAYSGEWWSYDPAAKGTTKVNDYQWRSPWEWFAEVYAISWLAKKKPPSGVDSAVAEYMWKGK
jgi:hypothetical protein